MPRSIPLTAAALAIGLLGPAAALAQSAAPPLSKTCDVVADSRNGGALEMRAMPGLPADTPEVLWRPSASGPAVMMLITYRGAGAQRMAEPSEVFIGFKLKADLSPDATTVSVRAPGGRSWLFSGQAIKFGRDGQAEVSFGPDWPYGRGLMAAIANNLSLQVQVQQDGRTISSESFALNNIDGRDTLLAQARTRYAAGNPILCK